MDEQRISEILTDLEIVGNPAFPVNIASRSYFGLTAREYFAAHAPITFRDAAAEREMFRDPEVVTILEVLVEMRYEYADEMIKYRGEI